MRLAVLHARGRVGTLLAAERELVFAYDADWRLRDDAFALSPRLPLREEPHAGEEVLFFFANLLPEGPVLDALADHADDEMQAGGGLDLREHGGSSGGPWSGGVRGCRRTPC